MEWYQEEAFSYFQEAHDYLASEERYNEYINETFSTRWIGENLEGMQRCVPRYESFKRITVGKDKGMALANYGFVYAREEMGISNLTWIQSLILGSVVLGTHREIGALMASGEGKSRISQIISIYLAKKGDDVFIVKSTESDAKLFLAEIRKVMNDMSPEYIGFIEEEKKTGTKRKSKFLKGKEKDSVGSIQFSNGGSIIALSGSSKSLKGKHGHYILDESDELPDHLFVESGRTEIFDATKENTDKYIRIRISNPRNKNNHFYKFMTKPDEDLLDDELIIHADYRIMAMGGRDKKNSKQFKSWSYFNDKVTCIQYILSDYINITDNMLYPYDLKEYDYIDTSDKMRFTYFLGIDPAGQGTDAYLGVLIAVDNSTGNVYVEKKINFKDNLKNKIWDIKSSPYEILQMVMDMIRVYDIKAIACDDGTGGSTDVVISELSRHEQALGIKVYSILFGEKSTEKRRIQEEKTRNRTGITGSALRGKNKKGEMYLDLEVLLQKEKVYFNHEDIADFTFDLSMIKFKDSDNNDFKLQTKKEVRNEFGKSPDLVDGLALAIHSAILFAMKIKNKGGGTVYGVD